MKVAVLASCIPALVALALLPAGPDAARAKSPAGRTGPDVSQTTSSLPDTIPLFPLPDVALFPGVAQPLHIFEPRYRAMIADALEGDRLIGMVMLRPGYQSDYQGNPPVYPVGGAGTIERWEELPDGRYNILLRGTSRFRIEGENTDGSYRLGRVEALPETLSDQDRVQLSERRSRLEERMEALAPDLELPPDLPDEVFVNTLCQFLPMDVADRRALLETDGVLTRADSLLELLGGMRQARVSR